MQPGRPEKGQKMFMKMICKEKDGSANEEKRQAEELNRDFYVIDPEELTKWTMSLRRKIRNRSHLCQK